MRGKRHRFHALENAFVWIFSTISANIYVAFECYCFGSGSGNGCGDGGGGQLFTMVQSKTNHTNISEMKRKKK